MEQKPNTKVDPQITHQTPNNNNNNNKQTLLQNPSYISPKQDLQQKLPTTRTTNLTKPNNNNGSISKKQIWDCGSTLYDSFELTSFQKQLDSAIINSSRSYSMPRLPSDNRRAPPPPQPQQPPPSKRPITSKVSRSFQKLLRSVFRGHKPNNNQANKPNNNYDSLSSSPDPWFLDPSAHEGDNVVVNGGRYFVVYDKPSGLSSIPEAPEVGFSPDINSFVRKTMSDRFRPTSTGISCS